MPAGSNAYKGLAVPLYGEFEQVGQSTANDQVTWTQKGGASGDLMVWRTSAGTELALVDASGSLILKDSVALEFGSLGAAAGDMVMQFDGTSLILASSTAGTRFDLGGTTLATEIDVRYNSAIGNGGGHAQWDASSQRLFLRQSAIGNFAKLNLTGGTAPAFTTVPTANLAPGDFYVINALGVTTVRLGYCTTGNSVRHGKLFNLAIDSAT